MFWNRGKSLRALRGGLCCDECFVNVLRVLALLDRSYDPPPPFLREHARFELFCERFVNQCASE